MRRAILFSLMLLGASVLIAVPRAYAVTNETTPCDSRVLRVQDDAGADTFDFNGDQLECWPHPGSADERGDNYKLNTTPGAGLRLYAYFGDPHGIILSIDTLTRTFSGFMWGQEDDPNFEGCRFYCYENLSYDANDYFYFDTGNGSTKVSLAYFEAHVGGLTDFNILYYPNAADHSVFSFVGTGGSGGTTAPGQPSLRIDAVGSTTIRVAWAPPSAAEGGTPTTYTWSWRSSDGDTWSKNYPAGDARITSPFTLTGLKPSTAYTIRLVALNTAGASSAAQQTATTLGAAAGNPPPVTLPAGPSLPAAPFHVTARPGNHRAVIRWLAPLTGAGIDGYQIHRRGKNYLITDPSRRSAVIRGLVNGRVYRFVVRAHNGVGWGAWSLPVKVRPHRR